MCHLMLPDVNKLCLADDAVVLFGGVKESTNSNLNRAVPRPRINFECSRHELPGYLSTKIVLDGIHNSRTADHEAILVVVELRVVPKTTLQPSYRNDRWRRKVAYRAAKSFETGRPEWRRYSPVDGERLEIGPIAQMGSASMHMIVRPFASLFPTDASGCQ